MKRTTSPSSNVRRDALMNDFSDIAGDGRLGAERRRRERDTVRSRTGFPV
jgi:hypothetical protein